MGVPAELGSLTSGRLGHGVAIVLVPLGSIEQHGPHLPLDTDIRIATEVATATAQLLEGDVLVAPPIPYGAAGEHQGFAGTISIGTEVLSRLLVEYCRSACDWAVRLAFVNGHGGNVEALRTAVGLLRTEGRDVAWCGCCVEGADPHAGHTETSVLLHLSPELVRTGDIAVGNIDPLSAILPRLREGGMAAVSPTGVLGDPTTATAAEGERIFAAMVADCLDRVRRWRPGPGGMLT